MKDAEGTIIADNANFASAGSAIAFARRMRQLGLTILRVALGGGISVVYYTDEE